LCEPSHESRGVSALSRRVFYYYGKDIRQEMKRIAVLLLCLIILLTSCRGKATSSLKKSVTDPDTLDFGGYKLEGTEYWYLDEKEPLVNIAEYEREVKLSNGKSGVASMRLPYLNVDIEGARSFSDNITKMYNEKYLSYFKKPDDRIVKVDYSYEIAQDTLILLMSETIETPKEKGTITYAYYYDIFTDESMDLVSFAGLCGTSLPELLDGLYNTQWSEEYLEETGFEPTENCLTGLTFNADEETFDLYCIDTNGTTQTVVTVTPVEREIDFSQLQLYEQ